MKQFSKIIFASMIGSSMAMGFMFFMSIALFAAMSTGGGGGGNWDAESGKIEDNSILRINFNGPLKDQVQRRDLVSSILSYDEPPVTGLFELSKVLKKAATDDRIKGLFLNFETLRSGMANAEALRRLIVEFKESGKFVMAYSENYSELDFLIASAVDEVVLYPKGFFEWDGLFSKLSYLQNTMKKIDVVPQVFRVGKYKSAIEPFITDKMSESSREQVEALIQGSWKQLIKYASEKTKLSSDELDALADDMSVVYAKDAKEKGFVNLLASFEEVEEKLKELSGTSEDKPQYVSWRSYFKEMKTELPSGSDNEIAVIFAEGGITTEPSDDGGISSKELTKLIHKIRREEKVKAVVIRVNSPGGSALASDVIWTATQWLKDAKPVVTSFGNVAASGGYYMSAGSKYIFAEPTTITGSIGVFGLTFATKKFWNEKIGMTFDTAKSHRFSDIESLVRKFEPEESAKIQGVINNIYEDFLTVVTNGREKLETKERAHELAQGRVWIGSDALDNGLVDEFGGLEEAVKKAAEFAELSDYSVEVYPKELSPFQEFMKQLSGVSILAFRSLVPETLLKLIKKDEKRPLHEMIHTRLPFDIEIR